jgi:drug/metabolite transporter (DMT)-like permease
MLRSPALALVLAALFWSGNFVVGRAIRDDIDPLALNFSRWSIALALLAPFVWRPLSASFSTVCREWRLILGLGATGITAFPTLAYLALRTTSATNALVIFSLAPIGILGSAALVGLERPIWRQVIGAVVSIAGAAILITRGDFSRLRAAGLNDGDLWMLAAVAAWSVYSLLLHRLPADLPRRVAFAASIAVALVLMAPLLAVDSTAARVVLASGAVLLGIGYVAAFASAIAFLFWSYGVSKLGASRSGQFICLVPVFGSMLAAILLKETMTLPQIVGALLVLSGILHVECRPSHLTSDGLKGRKKPP